MADQDGPDIAREIYERLFIKEGGEMRSQLEDTAVALDTVMNLMRKDGLPPSRWAQYVHYGI